MAKPERRDPAKEAFWRRMVLRFGRSKSTARDFCFEHGLSEANFYAWRREIARRDRETPSSSTGTARSSYPFGEHTPPWAAPADQSRWQLTRRVVKRRRDHRSRRSANKPQADITLDSR
jgi:hypothetical protein